jgi:hypothetical protein
MTQTAVDARQLRCMAAGLLAVVLGGPAPASARSSHEDHAQHRVSTPAPEPALPAHLQAVREALRKYEDPVVAVRDGYLSTLGCVAYAEGAMGVHFLNVAHIGPVPDPFRPPLLVYEPATDGRLKLVAAEWFVPLATGVTERPALFGQPFNGPMAGHEPLMPSELHHYDLHAWLWKENPAGLFAVTNPNVGCAGHPYALLERPTDLPGHQH